MHDAPLADARIGVRSVHLLPYPYRDSAIKQTPMYSNKIRSSKVDYRSPVDEVTSADRDAITALLKRARTTVPDTAPLGIAGARIKNVDVIVADLRRVSAAVPVAARCS